MGKRPRSNKSGCDRKPRPIPETGDKNQRRDAEIADTAMKARRGDKPTRGKRNNATAWYDRWPQIVADAGPISYGTPLGRPLKPAITSLGVTEGIGSVEFTGAGVARIEWIPSIGVAVDKNSPINRAAYSAYVLLRSKLKLSNDYDASDMMIGIMAVDSAFILHQTLRRVYGTMMMPAPPDNKYYPRTLVEAQGFDPNDIESHLEDFRGLINRFARDLYAFALPEGMTFADRHKWMCDNLYVDADSIKAQTYVFKAAGFWVYDNTVEVGSTLKWQPLGTPTTLLKYSDCVQLVNTVINTLLGDEDIANICGDLLNAFGDATFRHLESTDESYLVTPDYNEEVLAQITNIKFAGSAVGSSLVITQNPSVNNGAILFQPQFYDVEPGNSSYHALYHFGHAPYINTHGKHDPIDNIEMTRLTAVMGSLAGVESGSGVRYFNLESCGSEICTYFQIFDVPFSDTGTPTVPIQLTNSVDISVSQEWSGASLFISEVLKLQQFDWCWEFEVYNRGSASSALSAVAWDIENVTFVDTQDIYWMHDAALSSEFDIPWK